MGKSPEARSEGSKGLSVYKGTAIVNFDMLPNGGLRFDGAGNQTDSVLGVRRGEAVMQTRRRPRNPNQGRW